MMNTDKTPSELEEAARNQGPASSVKSGLSELIGGGGNAGGALETPASSQAGVEQLADSTQPKKSRTDDAAAGGKPSGVEGDLAQAVEGGNSITEANNNKIQSNARFRAKLVMAEAPLTC